MRVMTVAQLVEHLPKKKKVVGSIPSSLYSRFCRSQKIMNKTDTIFYLSMVVLVWDKVQDMVKPLVPESLFNWLAVLAVVVGTVSYALYGKLTGTREIPKIE